MVGADRTNAIAEFVTSISLLHYVFYYAVRYKM